LCVVLAKFQTVLSTILVNRSGVALLLREESLRQAIGLGLGDPFAAALSVS